MNRLAYVDARGRGRVLTRAQWHYLDLADRRQFEYGWGGMNSTRTVRLLNERGLIRLVDYPPCVTRWEVTGLTSLGQSVLARWRDLESRGLR